MKGDLPADPGENRLYRGLDKLPRELWADLAALDPFETCRRAGVSYRPADGAYVVPFLGRQCLVIPGKADMRSTPDDRPLGFQEGLVLGGYLTHAAETGLAGRMITVREFKGGELFFRGPHALLTAPVEERFGLDPAGFLEAAAALGAAPMEGGDAAFRLLALPKVLMAATLYTADEEFPASLTLTFDAATDRHLPLDCIWALVNVMSGRLTRTETGAGL